MASEQKGFIVYGDNEVVFDRLTDEEAGQLLKGMTKYFNNGTEPTFDSPLTEIVWLQIKLQMDRNADKYQKRCEKNRENVKKRYERIQTNTNVYDGIRPYTNATNRDRDRDRDRDTERGRDTDTESVPDASSLSLFLIEYLNEKAGTNHTVDDSVINRVQSLLDSGYTDNQLRTVIDKKCTEWLPDGKMRAYLRPSTLFGDKFGEYLNAPIPLAAERKQKQAEDRASLERTLSEKQQALSDMKVSLSGASKEERKLLRENIAILEDSIGLIEKKLGKGAS